MKIKELTKATRVIFLLIFMFLLLVVTRLISGHWLPYEAGIWFQFGLLLIVLGSFFLETYFTRPTDVVVNSIAVLVTLLALGERHDFIGWNVMVTFSLILLSLSLLSMIIARKEESDLTLRNRIAKGFYNISTFLGQGRLFFSIIFVLAVLSYFPTKSRDFFILILFWGFIIIVGPSGLAGLVDKIIRLFTKTKIQDIGKIIAVLNPNIIICKLDDNESANVFDLVCYHVSERSKQKNYGFVLSKYLLKNENWLRIFTFDSISETEFKENLDERNSIFNNDGRIYRVKDDVKDEVISSNYSWKNRKSIVGLVTKNSDIGSINFETIGENQLEEGMLLRILIDETEVYYQITNGITQDEFLDSEDRSGFIKGVAQQLGVWNEDECGFDRFGWVPELNSILFVVNPSEEVSFEKKENEKILGTIPKSQFPVVYDLMNMISHHVAILGITGSGKSWLAYSLIKEVVECGIKVICIDFTGEYKNDLATLSPKVLLSEKVINRANEVLEGIEHCKVYEKEYKEKITQIQEYLNAEIKSFMDSNPCLAIFELPDISNTFSILEFTQLFLQGIFTHVRSNPEKYKTCIVLEEAHTVIPEQATLGVGGDFGRSRGVVGKISQIALQGRKYSVGFMVIAQRTANVTKTVLNQCNSIIAFNAFDETGLNFLRNYVGETMVRAIPNLKDLQAVTVGKAFKSRNPMIVQIPIRESIVSNRDEKHDGTEQNSQTNEENFNSK